MILNEAKKQNVEEEEEEEILNQGDLVLLQNHTHSNKTDGYNAGLAQKWVGPFEADQ